MTAATKKTLVFISITYLISWLLIGVFAASGGEWIGAQAGVIGFFYMWIPGVVGIGLLRFMYREPVRKTLALYFKPNRWFLAAWIIPVLVILATNEVGLMLPWHEYSPEMAGFYEKLGKMLSPEQIERVHEFYDNLPLSVFWFSFITGLISGITINAVFALGEELGWRGFLLNAMSHLGFWKASALIGLIWGVWHAPIILMGHNYPDHTIYGAGMMVVFCLLLAPLHSYVRIRAGSVVAAALFHGTINGLAGIPMIMVVGGSDLTIGITGLAGFIVLGTLNLALFLFDRFVSDEPVTDLLQT